MAKSVIVCAMCSIATSRLADSAEVPLMVAAPTPAITDATAYRQMGAIIWPMRICIGFAAYHSAGINKHHMATLDAIATPAGPHHSPITNETQVTKSSTMPHLNQRSGLPIDRWTHP